VRDFHDLRILRLAIALLVFQLFLSHLIDSQAARFDRTEPFASHFSLPEILHLDAEKYTYRDHKYGDQNTWTDTYSALRLIGHALLWGALLFLLEELQFKEQDAGQLAKN